MSAPALQRHLALRTSMPTGIGQMPVDVAWLSERADWYRRRWLPNADIDIVFNRDDWAGIATKQPGPHDWGMIERVTGTHSRLFIDPVVGFAAGFADTVIAHEITHARFRTLGHSDRFFARVQETLNAARVTQDPTPTTADLLHSIRQGATVNPTG